MLAIKRSSAFKRDYKKIKANPRYRSELDSLLYEVLTYLLEDKRLPEHFYDHPLQGSWGSYRECHLKSDLLLIYKKVDQDTLKLIRLGSHSELFD